MNNNNNGADKFSVTIHEESLESQHQNVKFSDQTPQWDYTVDSMPDSTFYIADTNDATLENFFSRPIKIRSYSWNTGFGFFETFNPWIDFFENTRVINRISNYNLLRAKLKVRIMLNGNGFHYGRSIASYLPLHNLDDFTRNRALFSEDLVAASQRPHVYLDPTTSQGGTLTLPFAWYENALRIPAMDWRGMGEMNIRSIQNLKHANGANDSVTISVFVWAEEVSLSIPTANVPGALSPQMGEVFTPQAQDEYGKGPVSRPAGIIARAAGALSKVPVIGAYARATEMAASAVSNIATMFGYSRPVLLSDIQPYTPRYLSNLANTNVPDNSQKLTLDAKQELSIDPRIMGLGSTDEMTLKSIAQRESYLTAFGWAVSDTSESLLWNSEVSPVLWREAISGPEELHFPACCFATLPFRRWRGTMKFRFQIVASAFHKGRLKITYDPSYPVTNEYNTNYTHIIDLAKERDFTIDIGWGQEKSMLNHRSPGLDAVPFKDTPLGADPGVNANGIISVYVVNELTVPNSLTNNDIEVNVFVSAGDDYEVFDPDTEIIENLVWFTPQVGEVFTPQMAEISPAESHPDSDLTKNEDEPMKMEASDIMAPGLSDADHTLSAYYGDPVTSFRQCFKRYNWHSAITPRSVTNSYITVRNSNFPYYRGYAPGAVHETIIPAPGTPYNYCKMTLMNYITPAFTCVRGGLRWKYLRTGGSVNETSIMQVRRVSDPPGGYFEFEDPCVTLGTGGQSDRVRQAALLTPHTWSGATATSTFQNPVIEAEMPFYSNIRFLPAKRADKTSSVNFNAFHEMTTVWGSASLDCPIIHCYVSTGEDFNLGFFTGSPVAFRVPQTSDPPS
jgi:hypothetical protein